uniref:Uncharacterized protein n=1 Tax=Entomoneis paludosa TaxID=265537 RepID=A0A7S2YB46_9STRA|mmetsp:Transcript_25727/g.53610  ORF Transcript_25727/g.53610 Transcript_25727/m.53610 type:complete len:287 (+) Transcript_25727:427-1287(+)
MIQVAQPYIPNHVLLGCDESIACLDDDRSVCSELTSHGDAEVVWASEYSDLIERLDSAKNHSTQSHHTPTTEGCTLTTRSQTSDFDNTAVVPEDWFQSLSEKFDRFCLEENKEDLEHSPIVKRVAFSVESNEYHSDDVVLSEKEATRYWYSSSEIVSFHIQAFETAQALMNRAMPFKDGEDCSCFCLAALYAASAATKSISDIRYGRSIDDQHNRDMLQRLYSQVEALVGLEMILFRLSHGFSGSAKSLFFSNPRHDAVMRDSKTSCLMNQEFALALSASLEIDEI